MQERGTISILALCVTFCVGFVGVWDFFVLDFWVWDFLVCDLFGWYFLVFVTFFVCNCFVRTPKLSVIVYLISIVSFQNLEITDATLQSLN